MENNTNKQRAVEAIWNNPEKIFNCEFKTRGKYKEKHPGGEIRLLLTGNGNGIRVFGNSGSGIAGISETGRDNKTREGIDIFTYIEKYVLKTAGFYETLQGVANMYGFSLELSADERQRMSREALAREVAPVLIEALRNNPQGETAQYLNTVRGLQADGVHFGELTAVSLNKIFEQLKNKGYKYEPADLQALGLRNDYIEQGFNLVIPYYRNGVVAGFKYRNIKNDSDKNRNSQGLERGCYCDRLKIGERAVIVEGEIDAVRMIQAGVTNVIAMSGATVTENFAKLLKGNNITEITYLPDLEYNAGGEKKTGIIEKAIKAFQAASVDGEPVIKTLTVAEIETPADMFTEKYATHKKDGTPDGWKIDADDYGKNGGDFNSLLFGATAWWGWELEALTNEAERKEKGTGEKTAPGWFVERFDAIYNRVVSPYERELLKRYVAAQPEKYSEFGITRDVLDNVDAMNRNKRYIDTVKAASDDLQKAVEAGANPVKVAEAVAKLNEAQGANTRSEWDRQLTQTFADELDAISKQPDALTTKWRLGKQGKDKVFKDFANIEYWPADITVFCAATSHGKTAILFQSVLDLIKAEPNKKYLYVSCEENKRQLLERALNVYINIQTTESGLTDAAPNVEAGKPCFITHTRKKTIKAVIRQGVPPVEYLDKDELPGVSKHYNAVEKDVRREIEKYGTEIRPRLLLVHTEGSAENIVANVLHYVKEWEREGQEIGGVFIDYMQLLTSDEKTYNRQDELKSVCKALKRVASETELPIIIASQLNRQTIADGIDSVTLANLAEAADIERIAHDIYFIWQTDKTKKDQYKEKGKWNLKERSGRIFANDKDFEREKNLKEGYLYIERMKARDGVTGVWGLFPFDGERGSIGELDKTAIDE